MSVLHVFSIAILMSIVDFYCLWMWHSNVLVCLSVCLFWLWLFESLDWKASYWYIYFHVYFAKCSCNKKTI